MKRSVRRTRSLLRATALVAAVAALAVVATRGRADDRDLLRTGTAKPYLFVLLDTSASMNLKMGAGNRWAPGGADGPDSRLYQAKQALYDVLRDVDDVHFGFASFNQDGVHAVAKHWLYYSNEALPSTGWDINFPQPDVDGLTGLLSEDVDGDGTPDLTNIVVGDVEGDVLTFGPRFTGSSGIAGSCGSPLVLANVTDRQRLQTFAIDPSQVVAPALGNAVFWVKPTAAGSAPTYRLRVTTTGVLGVDNLAILFTLERATNTNCTLFAAPQTLARTLRLDANLNQTFVVDSTASGGNPNQAEGFAGLWEHRDVRSTADFSVERPFTGKGWDGNYDSGVGRSGDPFTNVDPHCQGPSGNPVCTAVKPVVQTVLGSSPALDRGDVIPFDWDLDNKHEFLRRLAPNHDPLGGTTPDFRGASYFQNGAVGGLVPLNDPAVRPLLAADRSPLAKAINDFRCWYLGKEGRGATGKCSRSAFFETGWETLACAGDTEFGCRRPYLIIISDGEDNISGEDATADVASMFSHSAVKTWALNLGDPRSCDSGGGLHPIVQVGGCRRQAGEECCITVTNRNELRRELRKILGQIRTEVRAFASAAVPSVQASVEQKVFFTNFIPFNDSPVWDGHVHGFLKPVPTDDGRPNTARKCDGSGDPANQMTRECHLWDAGQLLMTTQYDAADPLDIAEVDKRRVFYTVARHSASNAAATGDWPKNRRLFDPTNVAANQPGEQQDVRYDLWRGLGIAFTPDIAVPPQIDTTAQTKANAVIAETLRLKSGTILTGDTPVVVNFLLGDIFHSTPQVVGTPTNTVYFAGDLYSNLNPGVACDDDVNTASDGNPGYRCFFRRQQNRRKMLFVGSNDGMLHAFDAGIFREGGTDPITGKDLDDLGEFDNGSGHELFGYIPRGVMPTLTQFAVSDQHHFTVDGTVRVADVFIDPVKDSAAFPDPDQREWRTVLIGGLREGGRAYYALDVTQPDPVTRRADGVYHPPLNANHVPGCLAVDSTGVPSTAGCGVVPFPATLWEFDDSILDTTTGIRYQLDEDGLGATGDGTPDLGPTWSLANIGRIRICRPGGSRCNPDISADPTNDDDLIDRFVAIFGGGMNRASKTTPEAATQGNWLYMVDVETGQVLYKRRLIGAAPSEPAAVDTDQDGYLDRVYIGTLAGRLYRLDLKRDASGNLPAPEPALVKGIDPAGGPPALALPTLRIPSSVWVPRVLFDTRTDDERAAGDPYRPIYHRPSVIFVAKLGLYALAFGTGDREDLWSTGAAPGRFYVFVDDVVNIDALATPKDEGDLSPVDRDITANNLTDDFLLNPAVRGWVLQLGANERVITDAFALAGVTIFSSFTPKIVDEEGEVISAGCSEGGTGGGGGGGGNNQPVATCSRLGDSQIFVVNSTNANGFLVDATGVRTRYRTVANFVTSPFAEPGTTKSSSGSGGGGGGGGGGEGDPDDGHDADELTPELVEIMETLKGLFPTSCKFANYRIDIKTIAADTSLEFIAPVPVCLIERNWKEF